MIDDLAQEGVVAVALLLEIAPLGDVFHGGDPAAVRQRLSHGQERAPVGTLDDAVARLLATDVPHHRVTELVDVAIERAAVLAMLHQVAQMTARLHHVGRQIVHVDVALVEGDEACRGVERRQALDHVVERRIEPTPFRLQPLLRLAVLPGDLLNDQEQDQGDHRRRQRGRDDEESGLFAPVGQRGGNRVGCDHDARIMRERSRRSQPGRLIDRALHAQRLLGASLPDPLQQWRIREILADQLVDPWIARQQSAVGMKHRDGGAGSERHRSEEFFIIDRIDAPRHHAEEDAVFAPQSMGDDGIQIAGEIAANRLDQNGRRSRIEFEALEVGPLGNVERRGRQRPRPVDHVAVGIEDRDVAEIGKDARL